MNYSKRQKRHIEVQVQNPLPLSLISAIDLLQKQSATKFVESVDLAVRLGVDPRKSDQTVRGSVVLPGGTGKSKIVAVFGDEQAAQQAREAGADICGADEVTALLEKETYAFDVLITTASMMPKLVKFGPKLGPRGLMPNPKNGTVSNDIKSAVTSFKKGQVLFRNEKAGIVHCLVGKISFTAEDLQANVEAVLAEIRRLKPTTVKGQYIRGVALSSTMGPGFAIDLATLS